LGRRRMPALGHSRLRWSRPRLVHVRFNPDSDRQLSTRDPALRADSVAKVPKTWTVIFSAETYTSESRY
jgi:hypothetical protein